MILYAGNKLSVHGFTPTGVEYLGERLEREMEMVRVSDKRHPGLRLWDMLRQLHRRRRSVRLLLIDTYSGRAFWYACVLGRQARAYGIPYLLILRGGQLPQRLVRSPAACRQLFGGARAIVTPSAYLEAAFAQRGYRSHCIPNFIDLDQYPYRPRPKPKPALLWVRALHRLYRPGMALEVLALLSRAHPEARLWMVGPDKDGSLARCRALAAQSGIAGRVTFTGLLPKAGWIDLSRRCDFFLNTTDADNMPVSVIEAMVLGLPVVSTRVGGLPHLLEGGRLGQLVSAGDARAMATALQRWLHRPDAALQCAQRARKKVEAFDWYAVRDRWLPLIHAAQKPC
jgi:glycosyltransferase involved in cell wall biosynthesis